MSVIPNRAARADYRKRALARGVYFGGGLIVAMCSEAGSAADWTEKSDGE